MLQDIYEYRMEKVKNRILIVWGVDAEATRFAVRLLNRGVAVDYFLLNEKTDILEAHILNTRVIDIQFLEKLRKTSSVAIITSEIYYEKVRKTYEDYENEIFAIEFLRNELKGQEVILWGAGPTGREFVRRYGEWMTIDFFCDSESSKQGTIFEGKRVLSIDEVRRKYKDRKIIITSTYYKEISKTLLDKGVSKEQIYIEYSWCVYQNGLSVYQSGERNFGNNRQGDITYCSYWLKAELLHKRLLVYGKTELVEAVKNNFKVFEVEVDDVITRDAEEEDGTIFKLCYFDLTQYICILTDPCSEELLHYIKSMGIDVGGFRWLDNYDAYYNVFYENEYRKYIDPILGYSTLQEGEEYPGYCIYEYITTEKPVVILTSGGSTTTGYWTTSCWSRYLSDILKKNGISHRIYCGGIESYKTSQELLKLIRDGLYLYPDIVISLNGVNDVEWTGPIGFPFLSTFNEIFCLKSLKWGRKLKESYGKGFDANRFFGGIKHEKAAYEVWYDNNKLMHDICASNGIYFMSFLQPCIMTKKVMGINDRDCLALLGIYVSSDGDLIYTTDYARSIKKYMEFMQNAKQYCGEFICDLTEMFEGIDGCYMDDVHVFDEGNLMIANEVYQKLRGEIERIRGGK